MTRNQRPLFSLLVILFCFSAFCSAQFPWSPILPSGTGVDWSQAGIPGGIPDASWTQAGSTVTTTTCPGASPGSASGTDCTSTIQAALNACGANHYVLLGPGTFLLNSALSIPSNCVLRGSGTESTILNSRATGSYAIHFGSDTSPSTGTSTSITAGATQGSTSITVSSTSGYAVGQLMFVNQTNPSFVNTVGTEGNCTWCSNGFPGASGQIVEVTSVSGASIGFRPPLYYTYTPNSPTAYRYNYGCTNAGLENLEIYANNTLNTGSPSGQIWMNGTKYSWVTGVETNFADGGHAQISYSLGNVFRNNFFHDGFSHGPGQNDDQFDLHFMSSSNLVENNIFYRMHVSVMVEWGAAGNVIAYNYTVGNYHDSPTAWEIMDENSHGAHPWFNLWEGNIGQKFQFDTIWGSSSHNTLFRNYDEGSRQYIPPADARGTLGIDSEIWEDSTEAVQAVDMGYLSVFNNEVGDIAGSAHLLTQNPVAFCVGGTSPSSCVSGSGGPACFRWGYSSDSESPTSPSNYGGTFVHGIYECTSSASPNGTFQWASGVTKTLPNSFYLSSKPSYLGSVAWPGIGPDITDGNLWSGYVNANAAETCFDTLTLTSVGGTAYGFNPSTCYVSSPPPAPPTGLNAVVN
jgi:hypothetical protein